jgi:hypothetical protein
MLLVLAVLFPGLFAASVPVPVFPSELSWVAAVEFFANNQHLTGETRLFVDAKNERERVDTVMNGEGFGSTEILLPKQSLVYAIQWSDKSMTNGTCMMRKQSFPYKPFQLPADVKYQVFRSLQCNSIHILKSKSLFRVLERSNPCRWTTGKLHLRPVSTECIALRLASIGTSHTSSLVPRL